MLMTSPDGGKNMSKPEKNGGTRKNWSPSFGPFKNSPSSLADGTIISPHKCRIINWKMGNVDWIGCTLKISKDNGKDLGSCMALLTTERNLMPYSPAYLLSPMVKIAACYEEQDKM